MGVFYHDCKYHLTFNTYYGNNYNVKQKCPKLLKLGGKMSTYLLRVSILYYLQIVIT
ncbi:Hypothetical protein CKL_2972 [Clostridium kluyveri DSM 555]|uniref:Uncharacterized protein n=1 Tax=Clostridium kluyveri (strain ATCC 8527 / DSM 555 / NBRC 12016 / NCIMB 10680 / K1) TaxID=431943 RepID=A5N1I5_CLOK5|nr:Hypothetical protein CKL_2972 [Clostridium kluyveri DSM 555]